jgi:hypothetical protein
MRAGKSLSASIADTRRLKSVAHDGNTPQKHVWRSEIAVDRRDSRRIFCDDRRGPENHSESDEGAAAEALDRGRD